MTHTDSPLGPRHDARGRAPALAFRGVGLTRMGATILREVTWSVGPGEHWVVLGANGSGKTMLLSMAAGYLWPSTGEVTILGRRLGEVDLRELRLAIGWVSAALRDRVPGRETALHVARSGKGATIGTPLTSRSAEAGRALECMALLGCEHLADRPFGVLSQGEQQRVLIARALLAEPSLLVLDEVCSGLDVAAREQVVAALERLAADPDSPTLLLVTHHVEEIARGFTHALVLQGGAVLTRGPLTETLTARSLSTAFGIPVSIEVAEGRYALRVERRPGRAPQT